MIGFGLASGILSALWRNKGLVGMVVAALAVAGVVWLIMWQSNSIDTLKHEKESLEEANAGYVTALEISEKQRKAQIAAVAKEAEAARKRQQELQSLLEGVQNNDEKVTCPVPDFMRSAFERM